jgi:hypothetical protein
VRQLEIVLLLHAAGGRAWTAAEVATELRTGETWAGEQLAVLAKRSLARRDGAAYRYGAEGDLHAAVNELAAAYALYPVGVVTAIYSNPNRAARNFADAFRLRKDPPTSEPDPRDEGGAARG